MVNLANMLLEIQQRKARMDEFAEHQKKVEQNKYYEDLLAQLSIRATRMIEEGYNARSTEIDPAFSRAGMDVLPPFNDFLRKSMEPTEWFVKKDAEEAWSKFAEGWRKAGIRVDVITIIYEGYVRFTPILR